MTATIIVENGTIVSGANSYVSATELATFAANRGVTISGVKEDLLIKSMDYIESLNFKGTKFRRDQALQWPRVYVYIDGYYIDADDIPQELKNGQMQAALAIDDGNDPLQDLSPKVIEEQVGDLDVKYSAGSSSNVINRKIMNALWKLIESSAGQIKASKA